MSTLATALATFEGYYIPGSVASRNNNPGNLRAGPQAIGKDAKGYAIYATAAAGWADLEQQIGLDAGRGLTLSQFIGKYAPASDNNPTSNYLAFVAGKLGVGSDTPLSALVGGTTPTPVPAVSPPVDATNPHGDSTRSRSPVSNPRSRKG